MKKFIYLLITFLLIFSLTPTVAYGKNEVTTDNPNEYWKQNGYPDDISFAYEAGGEIKKDEDGNEYVYTYWEIGIVNVNEVRKKEIINMFNDNIRITFLDTKYSFNTRVKALNEIRSIEDENIISVSMILNSDKLQVLVSKDKYEEYLDFFKEEYGDIIEITDEIPIKEDTLVNNEVNVIKKDPIEITSETHSENTLIFPIIIISIMFMAILLYFKGSLLPTFVTNKGNIITKAIPINTAKIKYAIKNNEVTPDDHVFNSIMEQIKENK